MNTIEPIKYYFIIASPEFLLVEEPLEEMLRERTQHYNSMEKNIDFWILFSPPFLKTFSDSKCLDKNKENMAIISTNKVFITWLKLRLNNVFMGEILGPTKDNPNPLEYVK
ncbi:unnamed protein product [Chrysoparadoxa australica]